MIIMEIHFMEKQVSVTLPMPIIEILKARVKMTHRSMSSEIYYLIEVALAHKSESTREAWQFLYKLNEPQSGGQDQTP